MTDENKLALIEDEGLTADGLEAMAEGDFFGVSAEEHERLVSLIKSRESARQLCFQLGMTFVGMARDLGTMHDAGAPRARRWAEGMAATLKLLASQIGDVRDLLKGDIET